MTDIHGRKKIMIVEDEEMLSQLYRIKFEKENYVVKVCNNGMEAVTHVTSFAPDAILLDIMMPHMDGFETLRVIRELAPTLKSKIVMFSNLNNPLEIERCKKVWADAYLLKATTTPGNAVAKVDELLAENEPELPAYHTHKDHIKCSCPHCGKKFDQEIS